MADDATVLGIIGKYQVLEQLGQGGMGTVYRARDPDLDRQVAVKVIRANRVWNPRSRERFTREARALARINDSHVVQVFDFQPDTEDPYLVMELVAGHSLATELRQQGLFSYRRFVDCAWQVLGGLAVAHRAGVLHRDLKPSNILLAPDGTYKLVDFGLALHAVDSKERITGEGILGTCRYLSPEQARGEDGGIAGDLYAAGVTFFELLTGSTPFEEENTLALLQRIGSEPLPRLDTLRADAPPALVAWLARLTALDPGERFPDAAAARSALDAFADRLRQAGDTATAGRISATEPTRPLPVPALRPSGSRATAVTTLRPQHNEDQTPYSSGLPTFAMPRFSFFLKMLLAIWLVSSAAALIGGWVVAEHSLKVQRERWRQELTATAAAASLLIDGDRHAALTGPEDPYFQEVLTDLEAFRATNANIVNIYTMMRDRQQGDTVRFVVDASPEEDGNADGYIGDDERRARFMEPYRQARNFPKLHEGFERPGADEEINEDQWGIFLSGYAPIHNAAGESVGLVGVDASGGHIRALRSEFRWRSGLTLALTLLAFLAAAALVAQRLNQPLAQIYRVLRAIAKGDRVVDTGAIRGRSEFRQFADIIDHMLKGLTERDRLREAFHSYVARAVADRVLQTGSSSEEASRAAVLLSCDLRGAMAHRDPHQAEELLRQLLGILHAGGGTAERSVGDGFLAGFDGEPGVATEQAARCALRLQQAAGGQLGIGICAADQARDAAEWATALGLANRRLGSDILTCDATFAGIRHMFIGDRYEGIDLLPGQGPCAVIAIKGAVAG